MRAHLEEISVSFLMRLAGSFDDLQQLVPQCVGLDGIRVLKLLQFAFELVDQIGQSLPTIRVEQPRGLDDLS